MTIVWVCVASLAAPSVGTAEAKSSSVAPQDVKVKTPIYRPEFREFDPPLGTYKYEISWQGIPAAEAMVTVAQDNTTYQIATQARTYSGIDLFYKLRYRAEGIISALTLTPQKTVITQQENSRFKKTELLFHEDGSIESHRSEKGKDPQSLVFNPQNFTLDPFSAAFLARSLDWGLGASKSFDTFNGRSRYLITLTATELVTMNVNGKPREVFVIVPKVHNLNNQEQSKKLRDAKIYVTADKRREVLQISSSVFVGTVTTRLVAFEPFPEPPLETRVALQRLREEQSFVR